MHVYRRIKKTNSATSTHATTTISGDGTSPRGSSTPTIPKRIQVQSSDQDAATASEHEFGAAALSPASMDRCIRVQASQKNLLLPSSDIAASSSIVPPALLLPTSRKPVIARLPSNDSAATSACPSPSVVSVEAVSGTYERAMEAASPTIMQQKRLGAAGTTSMSIVDTSSSSSSDSESNSIHESAFSSSDDSDDADLHALEAYFTRAGARTPDPIRLLERQGSGGGLAPDLSRTPSSELHARISVAESCPPTPDVLGHSYAASFDSPLLNTRSIAALTNSNKRATKQQQSLPPFTTGGFRSTQQQRYV